MRIIGLTGSIACGKSTVSAYLVSRGIPVVDGDRLSRELTAAGSPVLGALRQAFGPDIFYEDGSLNRRRLGRIVFSDPAARDRLDDLMAPYLLSLTNRKIDEIRASGAPLCVLDMPLLFEKGYDRLCDEVWTVWLPEDVQRSRLMARDGYTEEEADARIRAVLSSDEKAARSDRVIDNSGSMENTCRIVSEFLADELALVSAVPRPRRSNPAVNPAPQTYAPQAVPPPVPAAPASRQRRADAAEKSASSRAPAVLPTGVPEGFVRPEAARTRKNPRKAAWVLPVWLKASLIAAAAVLMIGITAFLLMNAYLTRCAEQHAQEQANIDYQYPLQYRELIEKYAAEYNLSPAFVSAVIRNESSFRPTVESGDGARGLMQLMPDTAEWIARKLQVSGYAFERMYDPESNIRFGCWYLNYLSRLFLGDPVAVTAAYHAGQGQVKVWLSDPLLSEDGYSLPLTSLPEGPTKNYAGRVTRDYGIYQAKYFSSDQLPVDPDAADADRSGKGS
jgi:dephospho-CoA kinase